MKHVIKGTVEFRGDRFEYLAELWTGDDAGREDEVISCEALEDIEALSIYTNGRYEDAVLAILVDAKERIHYSEWNTDFRADETLGDFLDRIGGGDSEPEPAKAPETVLNLLCDVFEAWVKLNGLPEDVDARELRHHSGLAFDQRAWLENYISVWNSTEATTPKGES